jgi:hypothetical protein
MPDYRAYMIGSDGHIFHAVEMECPGDTEAAEQAKRLVDGHEVELWRRGRKVATFKHKPEIK